MPKFNEHGSKSRHRQRSTSGSTKPARPPGEVSSPVPGPLVPRLNDVDYTLEPEHIETSDMESTRAHKWPFACFGVLNLSLALALVMYSHVHEVTAQQGQLLAVFPLLQSALFGALAQRANRLAWAGVSYAAAVTIIAAQLPGAMHEPVWYNWGLPGSFVAAVALSVGVLGRRPRVIETCAC